MRDCINHRFRVSIIEFLAAVFRPLMQFFFALPNVSFFTTGTPVPSIQTYNFGTGRKSQMRSLIQTMPLPAAAT